MRLSQAIGSGPRVAASGAPRSDADLCDLARRAADGDIRARDALFARLYPAVRKHVSFVLGFAPICDEAVQESMVAIWRGLHGFRGDASPRTWALKIAARCAVRYARKEQRKAPPTSPDDVTIDPDAFAVAPHDLADVSALAFALARLKPKKREVFVLISLLGLTLQECAEIVGARPNTVASRYRNARLELEAALTALEERDG